MNEKIIVILMAIAVFVVTVLIWHLIRNRLRIWSRQKFEQLELNLRPFFQTLDESAIARLIRYIGAIIAFVVLLSTAYQIVVDINDRKDERVERQEDGIERAWTRLLGRDQHGPSQKQQSKTQVYQACGVWTALSRCRGTLPDL